MCSELGRPIQIEFSGEGCTEDVNVKQNLKYQKDTATSKQRKNIPRTNILLLKGLITCSQQVLNNHSSVKKMHQRKLKGSRGSHLESYSVQGGGRWCLGLGVVIREMERSMCNTSIYQVSSVSIFRFNTLVTQ